MRASYSQRVENARITIGPMGSERGSGDGAFIFDGPCGQVLRVIAAYGADDETQGWDHVSVSKERNPPNWQEMCWVKNLFFAPEETVVQFHPAESAYVNCHPNCLHLWRHPSIKLPPTYLVGVKESA